MKIELEADTTAVKQSSILYLNLKVKLQVPLCYMH